MPSTDPPPPPVNKRSSNYLNRIDARNAEIDKYVSTKIDQPEYQPGQSKYEQLSAYEQQRLLLRNRTI